ncbi:hypothetical protein VTN77DRAFT_9755 [Rasamsonia byssochlamydoides]|uniref:uncharacterized protein n=1 Tax=Rasamsonia byssochlamydoides TaxID=89139 RepID=UPI003743797A
MAFAIRRVVKLAGAGIGLGREAYLYHKEKNEARKAAQTGDNGVARLSDSMSRAHVSGDDDDIYIQLPEEDARDLIARGHAVPVTEEEQKDLRHIDDDDDDNDDNDSIEDLEHDWEMDEEASQPPPYDEIEQEQQHLEQSSRSVAKLVHNVVASAAIPTERNPLPFPVIIPQRRPGSKSRGFVRAYAPDLAASGISQETFMLFLNNFDKASQASPILQALFVSAGIVGLVPGSITMAVSICVQIAAGTAIELESRYKANVYLDQVNKELFMPRGLYAMVMRYKPGASIADGQTELGIEEVNLETAKSVARWAPATSSDAAPAEPPTTGMKIIKRIRISSGTTQGETNMPMRCAPLIFPTAVNGGDKVDKPLVLEKKTATATATKDPHGEASTTTSSQTAGSANQRSFQDKVKSARSFINDYYDRRAQAEYLAKNPDSTLAMLTSPPQFRSRYADPTDPTNNNLFNLLTGGHAHARSLEERRQARRQRRDERRQVRGLPPRERRHGHGPVGLVVKGVKKVLQEDVLYLMVVNLPSPEELREAQKILLENGWTK